MEMSRDARGFPTGDGAGGRTPHSKDQLNTVHDPPAWEEYRLYRIGTMLARKEDETRKRSEEHGIDMTHHVLLLENGQRIEVPWRTLLRWAGSHQAERVHLASEEAIAYAEDADAGEMEWTTALRKIRSLRPPLERDTTLLTDQK